MIVFLGILVIWIVSLCLHEYSHARVAYQGGDYTVASKGYLSLNPLRYLDPMTSVVLPIIFILIGGIALPGGAVWIETWRLKSRAWQSAVSLAGPASNLVMCVLLGLPFLLGLEPPAEEQSAMWVILATSCYFQAIAVVLNLLPIPGLDGFGALSPWLPEGVRAEAQRVGRYGFFILVILLLAVPPFYRAFSRVVATILAALGVPLDPIRDGLDSIRIF